MNMKRSLTEGSIVKGLFYFALPLMLSNFLQQLFNAVDSAVVGNFVGREALAAVGSTGPVINMFIGFFLGISTGTGVLYAMHYGAGDRTGLKKIIDGALILSVFAGLALTAVGIIFAPHFLRLMQTPDDVIGMSTAYLRILLIGTVPILLYNVGAGMIRAGGDSVTPLIYLFIGGVLNLILDLFFVVIMKWGASGAAVATVLAQSFSCLLIIRHLTRLPEEYRLRLRKMRLHKVFAWDITRVSVPCGLQSSMFNFANLIVQMKINTFGSVAMAGVTVYGKVDGFLYMPILALGLAISTYVAQNTGAGNLERIGKGVKICVFGGVGLIVTLAAFAIIFMPQLARIFNDEPEVVEFTISMMWFMAPFGWIFVFAEILGGAIRGSGRPMQVTIISAICICLFRVAWLIFVLPVFGTIQAVFIVYPLSWLLSSVVTALYYFKANPHRKAVLLSRTEQDMAETAK